MRTQTTRRTKPNLGLHLIKNDRIRLETVAPKAERDSLVEHGRQAISANSLEVMEGCFLYEDEEWFAPMMGELELAGTPFGAKSWSKLKKQFVRADLYVNAYGRLEGDHGVNEVATAAIFAAWIVKGRSFRQCIDHGPLVGSAFVLIPQ